jgi:hypothetical protein
MTTISEARETSKESQQSEITEFWCMIECVDMGYLDDWIEKNVPKNLEGIQAEATVKQRQATIGKAVRRSAKNQWKDHQNFTWFAH